MNINEVAAEGSTMFSLAYDLNRIATAMEAIVKELKRLNARDHARFVQDYNVTMHGTGYNSNKEG